MNKLNPWIRFLIYTFIISWFVGIILIIPLKGLENLFELPKNSISNLVTKYGPTLGGLVTAYLIYGIGGFKNLLKKGTKWKVGIGNYLFVLFLPFLTKIHIFWLLGHTIELESFNIDILNSITLAFFTHLLLGGGFGEEFGWRGFMLPELNKKFKLLKSSLIIGVFWTTWHMPAYIFGDKVQQGSITSFHFYGPGHISNYELALLPVK